MALLELVASEGAGALFCALSLRLLAEGVFFRAI